jgi:hypothetical protein
MTDSVVDQTIPGRKLAALDSRDFLLEFSWLAPIVYREETGEEDMTAVPAYRNEFIEMYKGEYDRDMPGSKFKKVVTLSINRRMPAPTRESNTPFDSTKEITPRPRTVERYQSGPGYCEILGQRFENIVQLDCWGRSNTEANALIKWVETFLVRWEFWFTSLGIDKMFYYASGSALSPTEAAAMSNWRQPFRLRSLEWYVRDEKLYYIDQYEIEAIRARILTEGSTRPLLVNIV